MKIWPLPSQSWSTPLPSRIGVGNTISNQLIAGEAKYEKSNFDNSHTVKELVVKVSCFIL